MVRGPAEPHGQAGLCRNLAPPLVLSRQARWVHPAPWPGILSNQAGLLGTVIPIAQVSRLIAHGLHALSLSVHQSHARVTVTQLTAHGVAAISAHQHQIWFSPKETFAEAGYHALWRLQKRTSVPFHLPCSVPALSGSLASSAVPGFYRCQYPRLAAHAGCQSLTHAAGCPMLSSLARARAHLATPQGQPNVPGTRRKNCKARIRGRGRWRLAPLATIWQLASTGHWLPSLPWPIVFP